jgi:hypothetical protein
VVGKFSQIGVQLFLDGLPAFGNTRSAQRGTCLFKCLGCCGRHALSVPFFAWQIFFLDYSISFRQNPPSVYPYKSEQFLEKSRRCGCKPQKCACSRISVCAETDIHDFLRQHIGSLSRKTDRRYFVNVYGFGYMLADPDA